LFSLECNATYVHNLLTFSSHQLVPSSSSFHLHSPNALATTTNSFDAPYLLQPTFFFAYVIFILISSELSIEASSDSSIPNMLKYYPSP